MKKETKNTKSNIQPLGDRVLVKREDDETTKTASGIFIPDSAKKESKIGVILAVGEGRANEEGKLIPMKLKVGTKVYFKAGWDNEFGDKDEGMFLVKEEDILAIIK